MSGDEDHFPYVLAEELGMSLGQVDALPYEEYIRWRAWTVYKQAMKRHAQDVAGWK